MHESQFRPIPEISPEQLEQFKSLITRLPDNYCMPWHGAQTRRGYGVFHIRGRGVFRAHRIAYCLATGDKVGGICVLHRCDNPPCCNPEHLFKGTTADNVADKMKKGRHRGGRGPKGSRHGRAKLNEDAVVKIRQQFAAGATMNHLARTYGVSHPSIKRIVDGTGWTHVKAHAVEGNSLIPQTEEAH